MLALPLESDPALEHSLRSRVRDQPLLWPLVSPLPRNEEEGDGRVCFDLPSFCMTKDGDISPPSRCWRCGRQCNFCLKKACPRISLPVSISLLGGKNCLQLGEVGALWWIFLHKRTFSLQGVHISRATALPTYAHSRNSLQIQIKNQGHGVQILGSIHEEGAFLVQERRGSIVDMTKHVDYRLVGEGEIA
mgnify:CR=1 FL=1